MGLVFVVFAFFMGIIIGSFFEKKRIEAINDPEKAKNNFWVWENPATLFFVKVKWWSVIFILMLIYFLIYGYVPVMTNRI